MYRWHCPLILIFKSWLKRTHWAHIITAKILKNVVKKAQRKSCAVDWKQLSFPFGSSFFQFKKGSINVAVLHFVTLWNQRKRIWTFVKQRRLSMRHFFPDEICIVSFWKDSCSDVLPWLGTNNQTWKKRNFKGQTFKTNLYFRLSSTIQAMKS